MKAIVYCRTTNKGEQTFYINVCGVNYYLFKQNFRRSVKEVFGKGVRIDELRKLSSHPSTSVSHTVSKLPVFIKYIEKEYIVNIYNKIDKKQKGKFKSVYKRKPFNWQKVLLEFPA